MSTAQEINGSSERQSLFIKEISRMATALLRGTNDILINVNWALGYLFPFSHLPSDSDTLGLLLSNFCFGANSTL